VFYKLYRCVQPDVNVRTDGYISVLNDLVSEAWGWRQRRRYVVFKVEFIEFLDSLKFQSEASRSPYNSCSHIRVYRRHFNALKF
jgi:hypothetical protein